MAQAADVADIRKSVEIQSDEMKVLRKNVDNAIFELGNKIIEQLNGTKPKEPDPTKTNTPFYKSLIDLDRPKYVECFLNDENYTPSKSVRVYIHV